MLHIQYTEYTYTVTTQQQQSNNATKCDKRAEIGANRGEKRSGLLQQLEHNKLDCAKVLEGERDLGRDIEVMRGRKRDES